jgi:hypothetical protein
MMNMSEITGKKRASSWYVISLFVMCFGTMMAAIYYPGGFDWVYTVVSALASKKHNPVGSFWLAGALSIAMVLLWPYVSVLQRRFSSSIPDTRFAIGALRTGLLCGALLGAEKLLIHDLSNWVYKAHEILALLTFSGLYIGILGLLVQAMINRKIYIVHLTLVAGPLIAIGITQFWLYIDQRDLGWVDISWREIGVPFWLSFAFWQWLAIVFLWLGLGLLALIRIEEK